MTTAVQTRARPTAIPARSREFFGDDYYGRPRFAKYVSYFEAPGTILDFGCNEGVFLNVLRQHGREGLGIDYDRRAVETCHEHGLEAIHADIFAFTKDPENRSRYGGVMMADFVEHFDPYPLQTLLRQTVGILKPGGTLAIVTPNSHSVGMNLGGFYECTIEHHNPYAVAALGKFLEGEGMEVVASGPDPDSRVPVFSWHPGKLLRNLAIRALGRILCGRDCMYEAAFVVARKVDEASDRFAPRSEKGNS